MRLNRPTQAQVLTVIGLLSFSAFLAVRWGGSVGPAMSRPVAEVAEQLGESSVERRREAAETLARRPGEAGPAQDALLTALGDPDLLVRSHAAIALGRSRPPAIGLLIGTLNHADSGSRHGAALALALIGPPAAPAVPRLVQLLRAEVAAERYAAKEALGRIGPAAVPALLDELVAGPPAARAAAADALGTIGRDSAAETARPLGVAMDDPDGSVRESAAGALANLGPAAVPILSKVLAGPNPDGRRLAACALVVHGAAATPEAATLIAALADPDPVVRSAAADALGRIGHAARDAVPALLAMQTDEASPVRAAATRALIRIIEDAPTVRLGPGGISRLPQTHLKP